MEDESTKRLIEKYKNLRVYGMLKEQNLLAKFFTGFGTTG